VDAVDPLHDTVPLADGDGADAPATYGRFVTRGVIGRGGMGVVMRARDPELDRDVALKVLLPAQWRGTEQSIGAPRLQREAQAMARLSHPNVVTVYEMGTAGEARFIAMELVEGTTLRGWLAAERRTWREIVTAFLQCGRGLEAAHAADLVHRDFKPENVLIGADGRPRVGDFGLVATSVTPLDGTIAGTPSYMAPEQWAGEDVDARADQFAFCVALWEALYRARPYAGDTPDELRTSVRAGLPRTPPAAGVPNTVLPILKRGLERAPGDRYPTMTALLAALERTLPRRTWLVPVIAGAGIAAAAAAILVGTRSHAETCPAPTEQLAGIWDDAARARAAKAGERVTRAIDAYAEQWLAASVAACKATQSQAVLGKRTICLERGRTALGVVTRTIATGDHATVERAEAAIARLPDLAACGDIERLDAIAAPPGDPALRARVDAVQRQVDAIAELRLRGKQAEAVAAAEGMVQEATAIGHAPTLAAAQNALGDVLSDASKHAESEVAYRAAASAAADGHDDVLAAEAWANVLFAASEQNERLDAAAALDPVVDAAVRRAGDPPRLRLFYLIASGVLADRRDDFATAQARFEAAIAIARTPQHRAQAMRDLAIVFWRRDGAVKAVDSALSALKATEDAMGPDHLETAVALYTASQITNGAGRYPEAKRLGERALAIQIRHNGPDSLGASQAHVNLGNIESNLHDVVAARAHLEKAIAIDIALHVPDASLAMSLGALASLLQYEGHQLAEAVPYYERSIELLAKSAGTDKLEYLMLSSNLAGTLEQLGRCADAQPIIAKIQPGLAKLPAYYPELLTTIGRCARDRDVRASLEAYEEGLALCIAHECDPGLATIIRWELGSALVAVKRDAKRGRALVQTAHDAALAADPKDPIVAKTETWLRFN
jgi:tetratricopeptide (TPR) repeat protein/tRNA A-37 threonylcarbamoyl transferase component Bud32